jgi:hypothetical protein
VELIREEGKGTHQRFTRCSVTIYTLVLISPTLSDNCPVLAGSISFET